MQQIMQRCKGAGAAEVQCVNVLTRDAIDELASLAAEINTSVENIGARRLQTVLERVLEETSFRASDLSGQTIAFDGDAVRDKIGDLAGNADLSRFIL